MPALGAGISGGGAGGGGPPPPPPPPAGGGGGAPRIRGPTPPKRPVSERTALMTVEGERDDICAVGQTVAAHGLCHNLPGAKKTHHLQLDVGHYGVFHGRRWQTETYPKVAAFIRQHG